jgi:hypothetical protein
MGLRSVILLDEMDMRLDIDVWEERAERTEAEAGETERGVEISEELALW